jgi:hypothetical protein
VSAPASLRDLFEGFESLPSRDAERAKSDVVDRILAAVAATLARTQAGDPRYRPVRDAAARVRLLAPGADGFDDAVLGLVDAARDAFDEEALAEPIAVGASPDDRPGTRDAIVTEASEESFPASDPPAFAADGDASP